MSKDKRKKQRKAYVKNRNKAKQTRKTKEKFLQGERLSAEALRQKRIDFDRNKHRLSEQERQFGEATISAIELLVQNPQPCIGCGSHKVEQIGMWIEEDPKEKWILGIPENKSRIIPYMICRKCFLRDDSVKLAEDNIKAMILSEKQTVPSIDFGKIAPSAVKRPEPEKEEEGK